MLGAWETLFSHFSYPTCLTQMSPNPHISLPNNKRPHSCQFESSIYTGGRSEQEFSGDSGPCSVLLSVIIQGIRSPSPAFAWGDLRGWVVFPGSGLWEARGGGLEFGFLRPQAPLWISSCNVPLSQSWWGKDCARYGYGVEPIARGRKEFQCRVCRGKRQE